MKNFGSFAEVRHRDFTMALNGRPSADGRNLGVRPCINYARAAPQVENWIFVSEF